MNVVVAILLDDKSRVLITRRPLHVPQGGLWEFPGGKLEAGESPAEALIREIKEEVSIEVQSYRSIGEIVYHYECKVVNLLVFEVDKYLGKATCCESQMDLRWVPINELPNYDFPAANKQIIRLIENLEEQSSPH